MTDRPADLTVDPLSIVRPLLRARQVREFTDEPLTDAQVHALTEVARWTGSSRNEQPWRFILVREQATLRALHDAGLPQTRSLATATAAIAIVLPAEDAQAAHRAYDDGRAAERVLIAAGMLGLGAGIAWVRGDVLPAVRELLALPDDRLVRTIIALGHPSEAAKAPKSAPGEARLPRTESVKEERWG